MNIKLKNIFSKTSHNEESQSHKEGHELLPIKLYIKIFFILLIMIFMNIGISRLPFSSGTITFLLLTIASIQSILVGLFFMELIHENKFYSFVFGSAILFMLLFFIITLYELNSRDQFDKLEGIRYMRSMDLNNNYAPGGPEMQPKSEEKK